MASLPLQKVSLSHGPSWIAPRSKGKLALHCGDGERGLGCRLSSGTFLALTDISHCPNFRVFSPLSSLTSGCKIHLSCALWSSNSSCDPGCLAFCHPFPGECRNARISCTPGAGFGYWEHCCGSSAWTSLCHACLTAHSGHSARLSLPQRARQQAQRHLCCCPSLNLFAEFLSPHPEFPLSSKTKLTAFLQVCLPSSTFSSDFAPKSGRTSLLWGLETLHLSVVLNPGCTFESIMNVDQLNQSAWEWAWAQVTF